MVQKELRKFSQWFGKGFRNGMMEGGNGIIYKRIFEVEVFFSSENIDFSFYLKRLLELSFFFLFFNTFSSSFSLFFLCSISWVLGGFDNIRGEKWLLQQLLFKWNRVDWLSVDIDGGRIF
jgi:hypothetical protein